MAEQFKIALAGATGQMGKPILEALIANNYPVVVLSRSASPDLPKSSLITIVQTDYSNPESITPHLQGVHTVIAALGSLSIAQQKPLVEAAFQAKVKRFIPSEFGCDTVAPRVAALPVYKDKVAVRTRLAELAATSPDFTWTSVHNNAFLDSGLHNGFIASAPRHSINLYDEGTVPFSTTRLSTIAQAVLGILSHLEETKNRPVYIHDLATTQAEIMDLAKEIDGEAWSVAPVDTAVLYEDSDKELRKEKPDFGTAMLSYVRVAAFGKGWGCDFSDKLDNELLGVKGMSKEELKEYIAGYLK
jgi:hypothetical protein